MEFSRQRFRALIRKEFIQLLRDWRTLLSILLIPVVEMFLLAYAVNLTIDHIPMAVADFSLDDQSRALIHALEISGYFDVVQYVDNEAQVIQAIDEGRARAGLVIPPGFAESVARGEAQALMMLDGSDSFTLQSGYGAALAIAQARSTGLMMEKVSRSGSTTIGKLPIFTALRILYNPNMDGMVFMVPATAAMLLQVMTMGMTAMSVVREQEMGTLEQLLVTPARPMELILGKLVPNVLIASVDMIIVVLLGIYWFGVPFQGNPWLLGILSLLFIVSGLGLGLLASSIAHTQREAGQMIAVLMMLANLLTGFIYPRTAAPLWVQLIGDLIPLTYFLRIIRGIFTKGVGIRFIWQDAAMLLGYSVVVMVLAAKSFKTRLD